MKMEWIRDNLFLNGILVAQASLNVEYHDGKDDVADGFYWCAGAEAGRTDTIEAAKAAAEDAVRKWFREADTELAALKERLAGLRRWILDDLDPNEPRMAPASVDYGRTEIATYVRAADLDAVLKENNDAET